MSLWCVQVVYIAPLKALVRERIEDWKIRIEEKLGKKYEKQKVDLKKVYPILSNKTQSV